MPRKSFVKKLNSLNQKVTNMGIEVDLKIEQTITAFQNIDLELAKEVAESDNQIDQIEHQIEQFCMNLFALEQPIASDLRMVAGCLKIITDIERVADQCADVCEIITTGQIHEKTTEIKHLIEMLEAVHQMFHKAMDAFTSRNVDDAIWICKNDDQIDAMFSKIVLEGCKNITNNSENVMQEVDLMFITKYIERMGDHCTNIAEWVIYMETGEHPDLNQRKEKGNE